ncbi:hypothetical protein Hanom_Chr13g01236361 [Helianthus anomalus]
MQNYYRVGVSLEAASLFLWGKGKVVYISPSSNSTFALLLVGFIDYDDDDHMFFYLKISTHDIYILVWLT